jgi:hypothetical protein
MIVINTKNLGGTSLVVLPSIPVNAYVVEHFFGGYAFKDRIVLFNDGVIVAKLFFFEKDQFLKEKSVKKDTFWVICFERERLGEIINTLRYEKPIYLVIDYTQAENKIEWGMIHTDPNSPEFTGEQEGV